jgi:hypothetical protein
MAITQADVENYGEDFIDLTRRAAADAVQPALNQLRQENVYLRQMAQRSQNASIQQALDRALPNWQEVYGNPAFSTWLESQDPYAGETRSQLLRRAVAAGDASRVVRFYQGFLAEHGHAPASQRSQSRQTASGGNIYTRQQIAEFYKRRQNGLIDDKSWAAREADIFAAANQGRVVGAIGPDGTEMSRWR